MSDVVDFRGGDFRGPVIGKAEYRQQAPAPAALDALPPRAAGFTGRDQELGRLRAALDPSGPVGEQAVLVTAVSGLGGIGKTALAVQAAYAAREAGWFPGGVLFVDLHGYDDAPVTADQALQSLLRALGVEPEHIPATADERAGLYRSVLARREAVLILADNASSPGQVRPLLPGGGRHRVLVTSRHRLPTLGARLLALGELRPDSALALLDRALRAADPGDSRIAEDRESATRLAELCGRLPLALQIAAAVLSADPGTPVHELCTDLANARSRVDRLDDGERSVRLTFDLSYQRLPEAEARLLRLFALLPGRESGLPAVEALRGDEPGASHALLSALERAHLVERGSHRERWRLHDLVREFAADQASTAEREAARERVLSFYLAQAEAADLRWRGKQAQGSRPQPFRDREEALAWLDEERENLVGATRWAAVRKLSFDASWLAAVLADYLEWRRYFDDGVTVSRCAQAAAERAGDAHGEADAWNRMGISLRGTGRMQEAFDACRRAYALYDSLGRDGGKAKAVANMGMIRGDVGQVDEAVDAFRYALALLRVTGDRHSEAGAWNNLAITYRKAGRVQEALDALKRALELYRETGDRLREGRAWHNYGITLNVSGRTRAALDACLNALDICEMYEDRHGEGQTLYALGLIHETAGEPAHARLYWLRASEAYDSAGSSQDAAYARRAARFLPRTAQVGLPALTAPGTPTGTPAPAAPPARTAGSGRPVPRPPGAPGNGAR
ncbi:tetratricopeptide repeat protein [Streptomyces argyrophylli]|uniref:tetratricopeptide repeat protein n=1 Tax=Streptomyces argyrophylli TaxID=2726118 RepID=UPI002868AA86|nr:tetratricopeptide repeat protein [Streptomyces argyrophyllae]